MKNQWIFDRIRSFGNKECLYYKDQKYTYNDFAVEIELWMQRLQDHNIQSGEIIAFISDNQPSTLGLLVALILNGNIAVPLSRDNQDSHSELFRIAEADGEWKLELEQPEFTRFKRPTNHAILCSLVKNEQSGLILFTSGSTGEPKAAVHNMAKLLAKHEHEVKNLQYRALIFLKLFHIGGINTLFSFVLNGGSIVLTNDRSPEGICTNIQNHQVELLPITPTFVNMLLLARAHEKFDLSSLKVITYGAEPMPESTLLSMNKVFPEVKLKQTYGFTELGILSTKSKASDSLWIKINKKNTDYKIENNILFVKNNSSMLGYLNAPSPIDQDGWFDTGDLVEQDGEFLKILGREKEIINVGGEKVYPAHVENVLIQIPEIEEVVVAGKKNPITGSIVAATVTLNVEISKFDLLNKIKDYCQGILEPHEIPRALFISKCSLVGDRFKKQRLVPQEDIQE